MPLLSPGHQWPPHDPPQYAANIARKELWKRVKKYLGKYPQKDNDAYRAALRLLRTDHIGALIGYDVDEKRLEVIIHYSILIRRKYIDAAKVCKIDHRLPPQAVSAIINNLDPFDRPVVADVLALDYLETLEDSQECAVISDDDLDESDVVLIKQQMRLFAKELQRIHEDIRNGTLWQP